MGLMSLNIHHTSKFSTSGEKKGGIGLSLQGNEQEYERFN